MSKKKKTTAAKRMTAQQPNNAQRFTTMCRSGYTLHDHAARAVHVTEMEKVAESAAEKQLVTDLREAHDQGAYATILRKFVGDNS
jgi:hypothetical protein